VSEPTKKTLDDASEQLANEIVYQALSLYYENLITLQAENDDMDKYLTGLIAATLALRDHYQELR
jgi:hypothetical protein